MKTTLAAAISKLLAVSCVLLSVPAMASDQWAMDQANPAHTGYIPVTIDSNKIAFRWKKQVSTSALNPITVAAGSIFASDWGYFNTQHLYAINKNGQLAWGKSFSDIFSINPPSYADGKVYVQTGNSDSDTYLRAYAALSGNLVFQAPHAAQWERYLAPTIYKGNVYINGGTYGGMYSFNGGKGKLNWFYGDLPQVDNWTPAVDEKLAYSYIGSLYAVDRLTGKHLFTIANSGQQQAVPMLGGLNDVFVVDGGMLNRFKTDTHKIAWQKTYNFNEDYTGQPALANSVVYVGTTKGSLVALDQATGKILWAWKNTAKGIVINNIVATKSHVFFTTENKLYAVDLKTQQNVWSYPVSGHLALGESGLYVASGDGTLTAFGLGLPDIFATSIRYFWSTAINATQTKTITIRNVGDKKLTISDITSASFAFIVKSPTAFVLAPNQSKQVEIDFTPSTAGLIETDLTVKSDDENEPEIIVHLKGKGISS
ncbi:MAG: PQQ-binding-like beta-propeller repeat protein [Methylovulum sp.]|nr:PQQ-binding-like beta-propeller repeat protein [Methylovulum sp.]